MKFVTPLIFFCGTLNHALKMRLQPLHLKKEISRNQKINEVVPFLDYNGLLRVGGRIAQSEFCLESKHPILLPKDHKLTHLLLVDEHQKHLHLGYRTSEVYYTGSQKFYT